MTNVELETKIKALIDDLKSVCANYGLGNDGNEFKIITQIFLYKFINDKFIYESKITNEALRAASDWQESFESMNDEEIEMLLMQLNPNTARLRPSQFISKLYKRQNEPRFADIFDSTLLEIATENSEIFSVKTFGGERVVLFESLSRYVTDNRDEFCKALVNKLVNFSFEKIFTEKFDFFSTIFEYLIKDYNTNSGGKYAEYFTPHAVAKIMASCLVQEKVQNVTCYDPSAGSGTLLMSLAHEIGEDRCSIFSQDISQKSSNLLRLNLILNNLVHSIPNIVKGNTILEPFHRDSSNALKKFDYIVSNPPFKLDFSDWVGALDTKENKERFFAGFPKVPKARKEGMAIYPLFIQHIVHSLSDEGKAAIVVPTGFITAQSGIECKIREKLVKEKMLRGVITMPSNIFATTGTNVSIIFIDKANKKGDIVLMDASSLGTVIKEGKNQRTVLSPQDESKIIETFREHISVEEFSIVVSYDQMEENEYSFSAGQYFDFQIEYSELSNEVFSQKCKDLRGQLDELFKESISLKKKLDSKLDRMTYETK